MTVSTSAPAPATAPSRRAARWALRLGVLCAAVAAFTWWCGTAGATTGSPAQALPAPAVPDVTLADAVPPAPVAGHVGPSLGDVPQAVAASPAVQAVAAAPTVLPPVEQVAAGITAPLTPVTAPVLGEVGDVAQLVVPVSPVLDPLVAPLVSPLPHPVAGLLPDAIGPGSAASMATPFGPLAPAPAELVRPVGPSSSDDLAAITGSSTATGRATSVPPTSDADIWDAGAPDGPLAPPAPPAPGAPIDTSVPRSSVSAGDHGSSADGYLSVAPRHGATDGHRLRATDARWTSAPPARPPVAPD